MSILKARNMYHGCLISFNFNQNKEYKDEELEIENKKSIALFGTYVRSQAINNSDIDLLVEFKEEKNL